jgi:hypothetical protein
MLDDPREGHRLTDDPEAREETAPEKKPPNDAQDRATIEEFRREGVGVSAKE